ncbi:MAG TPA: alpha/beta hydrolase [Steroidobacteraceae bacterium]
MHIRENVRFKVEGNIELGAWLYLPKGGAPKKPAITMAHGYAGTREHGIAKFAEAFADAGFVVLLHDHRTFGVSDGEPRQDIDPWRQIADWRRAISYLESRSEVNASRIGLWGTSYAGGHALVLGATDRRIACVVAQVPTISGYEQGLRRVVPEAVAALEAALDDDERSQAQGQPPRRQAVVSADIGVPAAYRTKDAIDFYLQPLGPEARWENFVTMRSTRLARMYEPGAWVSRIAPTPLLMVIGTNDTMTLSDLGLEAYERAHEPKKLVRIPGGHFDPYLSSFDVSSSAALSWFQEHLTH